MPTIRATWDYDAEDMMIVGAQDQLRALANDLRAKLVAMLRERAASTSELAAALGLPKGTVGYHLKVLERAGLIRVVRTRKVRAVTEKSYGRVARLFVLKGDDSVPAEIGAGALGAIMLRQAADELLAAPIEGETVEVSFGHARLRPADARRLLRRSERLVAAFRELDDPEGELYGFAIAAFPSRDALPPRDHA